MVSSKKKLIRLVVIALLAMGLFSGVSWAILDHSFHNEIYVQLQNLSIKNSEIIEAKIRDGMNSIEMLAASMEQMKREEIEKVLENLQPTADEKGILRFGIAGADGECYTSDHRQIRIGEYDFFQRAWQGETVVQEERGIFEDMDVSVYATPIRQNGKVVAVLHATQSTKDLADSLIMQNLFDGAFSVIIDAQGQVMIDQHVGSQERRDAIRSTSFQEVLSSQEVQTFTLLGKDYIMANSMIQINGWSEISFVPAAVISAKTMDFNLKLMGFYGLVTLILLTFVVYIYITKRKQEREKEALLFLDHISGLHNFTWLQEAVNEYRQSNSLDCIVAVFNIKEFRYLNRKYGFEKGDEILRLFMQMIHVASDAKLFGARYEKDRYIALIDRSMSLLDQEVPLFLEALTERIEQELHIQDVQLSVGFYHWKLASETLLSASDKAVYALREPGTGMIHHYSETMETRRLYEKELEGRMEEALIQQEFVVYYQPKVSVLDERIAHAEALVRWKDPQRGLISPGDFIPLFEKNGFLEPVDFYVYEQVCRFIADYRRSGKEICISFNVSMTYIFHDGFAKKLNMIAKSMQVPCACIEVEITETAAAENTAQLIELLNELHGYGFRIAMDDFGSGYSSLNMLKEIPVDTLKIDQGFFTKKEENLQKSEAIITLISEMAHQLQLEIVAEGVETAEQLAFVKRCGCQYVQGYYYYKPLPLEEFQNVLRQRGKTYEA